MKEIIKKFIPGSVIKSFREYRNKRKIRSYSGHNVICPICYSEFSSFAPYLGRKNARCLKCESLERHRLLWKYLNEKTDISKSTEKIKLLHFAPEKMFYYIFTDRKNIDYYPCDLSPERYTYNGNVRIIKADITNIPFENNYFDVILCNHVLEHIVDDKKAMTELYRVMKNGGWGIFQVPVNYDNENTYEDFNIITPEGREKAFGLSDHVRLYGRDYGKRLENIGFIVTIDDYVNNLSCEDRFINGLDSRELIYLCKK